MSEAGIIGIIVATLEEPEFEGVVSAYLFGSVAENRMHRESDVDVGVLLDRTMYESDRSRFDLKLLLSSRLSSRLSGRPADVVVLNDAPPQFAREIVTRGQRLVRHDTDLDHAFVRDVQLRAADLQPFLERMRKIKLEAMAPR